MDIASEFSARDADAQASKRSDSSQREPTGCRERGEGPLYMRITRRVLLYERDDLEDWLASRKVAPRRGEGRKA